MRFFLDFEFLEDGRTIDPVSIALVPQSRKYEPLYLEFDPKEFTQEPNDWVLENVYPYLRQKADATFEGVVTRYQAKLIIYGYIGLICRETGSAGPSFWGYYCDYDWVAFCRLWGKMVDLPDYYPKVCWDVKQIAAMLGVESEDIPRKDYGPAHRADVDALTIRDSYEYLMKWIADRGLPVTLP